MSIIEKLACSQGRRDEVPNVELAREIARSKDGQAVRELVALLGHKSKDIRYDSIKVLYEIGGLQPALLAGYSSEFLALLESKDNWLQWGGMTALQTIVSENPELIFASLPRIIAAAGKGSVITRDYAVQILIRLCAIRKYAEAAFAHLIEQLLSSPPNQLPMYAEQALPVIDSRNKDLFVQTLRSRLDDIEKDTKRKRVEKVIAKTMK